VPTNFPKYDAPLYPAIIVEGPDLPARLVSDGAAGDFGLAFRYERVLGLTRWRKAATGRRATRSAI